MSNRQQVRSKVCTIQLDKVPKEDWYLKVPQWDKYPKIRSAYGQIELGEQNKKPHWQIFIEAVDRVTLQELWDMGLATSKNPHEGHWYCKKRDKWIQMRREKAIAYVTKDTEYPESRFEYPTDVSCFKKAKEHYARLGEYDGIFAGIILDEKGLVDLHIPKNNELLKKLIRLNLSSGYFTGENLSHKGRGESGCFGAA